MEISQVQSKYDFGTPNIEQLGKINKQHPKGMEEDMVTMAIRSSDHLLSNSNGVWKESSLKKMAETFIGKLMNKEQNDGDISGTK